MKILLLFLAMCFLGCSATDCFEGIKVSWDPQSIVVMQNNKILIRDDNTTVNPTVLSEKTAAYCIDSTNCVIYVNSFNNQLKSYKLPTGRLLNSVALASKPKMTFGYDYTFQILKKFLIVKSNRNLVIYGLDLKDKVSIIDSLFKYHPRLEEEVHGFWDYKIEKDHISVTFQLKKSDDKIVSDTFYYQLPWNGS